MIDPRLMTRYDQTQNELEETLVFCVCVAGHNADTTAKGVDGFLRQVGWKPNHKRWKMNSPFEAIRRYDRSSGPGSSWNGLEHALKDHGLGCFNLRAKCLRQLYSSGLDLAACSTDDLERIDGIGPKTSRFFVLHTRRDAGVAALDTHVLKYLKAVGVDVPKTTPPAGKRYKELEAVFIDLASRSGMTVAAFDLLVWNYYAKNSNDVLWVIPRKVDVA